MLKNAKRSRFQIINIVDEDTTTGINILLKKCLEGAPDYMIEETFW